MGSATSVSLTTTMAEIELKTTKSVQHAMTMQSQLCRVRVLKQTKCLKKKN